MPNPVSELLSSSFSPLVAVASSEAARELCAQSGLTCAELLRPFGPLRLHQSVKLQSKSYNIKDFVYRTMDMSEIGEPDPALFDPSLGDMMHHYHPEIRSAFYSDLGGSQSKLSSEYQRAPWVVPTLSEILRFQSPSPYLLNNQPMAMVAVASSHEENPVACLTALLKRKALAPALRSELYDSGVPLFYVLLHDPVRGATVSAESLLKDMKKQFTSSKCFVLPVNSQTDGSGSSEPWVGVKRLSAVRRENDVVGEAAASPGRFLSSEDREALQDFVKTLCSKGVVPQLQGFLVDCEELVRTEKRGLTNTFKSWLRKPKVSKEKALEKESSEWKTLLCAHIYLMLKDFDAAAECFKFSKDDWKAVGNAEGASWCYFFLALCQHLQKAPGKSILHNLTSSMEQSRGSDVSDFQKSLFQTLLSLFSSLALTDGEPYVDTCLRWMTQCFGAQKTLLSSTLLTQMIVCLFRLDRVQRRKVILYSVLSIHIYEEYKLHHFVVRSAHLSLLSLQDNSWWSIIDYLRTVLCNAYTMLGESTQSVPYFLQLISSSNSTRYQLFQSIVRFKQVIKELFVDQQNDSQVTLELPLLDEESVFIVPQYYSIPEESARSNGTGAGGECATVEREPSLLSFYKREKAAVAAGQTRFDWAAPLPDATLESGHPASELLTLSLTLRNPLNLKLQVKEMRLVVEMRSKAASGSPSAAADSPGAAPPQAEAADLTESVEILPVTVVIEPKSSKVVYLQCRPTRPGALTILGCQWVILDYLNIRYEFKGKPEGKKGVLSTSHLSCDIDGQQGCLELTWGDFPSLVHQNGLYPIRVELSNSGTTHLKNIEVFSVDCLHAVAQSDSSVLESSGPSGSLTALPSTLLVSPDNSISILIWVSVVRPVSLLEFLFRYQVFKRGTVLANRYLIQQHRIQTIPTVSVSGAVTSALTYGSFRVQSELQFLQSIISFKTPLALLKVSSLGRWTLGEAAPEGPESPRPSPTSLEPGASTPLAVVASTSESGLSSERELSASPAASPVPAVVESFLKKKLLGYTTLLSERKEYDRKVKDAHIRGITYRPNFVLQGLPLAHEPTFETDRRNLYLFYHWCFQKCHGLSLAHVSLAVTNDLYSVSVRASSLDHDFSKSACLVPVTVQLHLMSDSARRVRFQALCSPNYLWVGKTSHTLELAPRETLTLPFECVLEKPGIYNLNQFEYFFLDQPSAKLGNGKEKPVLLTLRTTGSPQQEQTRQRRSSTSVDQSMPGEEDSLLQSVFLMANDHSLSQGSLSSESPTHGPLVEVDCSTPRRIDVPQL